MGTSQQRKYTQEILEEAVEQSVSFAGVIRHLGLKQAGGTQSHIATMIRKMGIDTSHFTGQGHMKGKSSPKRMTPDEVFALKDQNSPRTKRSVLLRCMLEVGFIYECENCGLKDEWCGKILILEIDHKNGHWWDNRKENLRFLCPNCHSQQLDSNTPHKYR